MAISLMRDLDDIDSILKGVKMDEKTAPSKTM